MDSSAVMYPRYHHTVIQIDDGAVIAHFAAFKVEICEVDTPNLVRPSLVF